MGAGPDLFVVCKNCGSQVSPYITECPYCGSRIRKRAPKIEREEKAQRQRAKRGRRRGPSMPSLGPLRSGEIPGVRGDELRKPIATMVLVAIGCLWWLAIIPLRDEAIEFVVAPLSEPWGVFTAPFIHLSGWYQFAALGAVGIFGWVVERKYGWLVMLLVWLVTASGGLAVHYALSDDVFVMGASYGALGLLCAWAVPILLERRRDARAGTDPYDDADLIGAAAVFTMLVLMPAAREEVSVIATAAGVVLGSLLGLVLSRVSAR